MCVKAHEVSLGNDQCLTLSSTDSTARGLVAKHPADPWDARRTGWGHDH